MTLQDKPKIERLLTDLRLAVVRERAERTDAPFEAKQQADRRIAEAHSLTVMRVLEAFRAGATKTKIAEQLGIRSLTRVQQLIEEGTKQALDHGEHHGSHTNEEVTGV